VARGAAAALWIFGAAGVVFDLVFDFPFSSDLNSMHLNLLKPDA